MSAQGVVTEGWQLAEVIGIWRAVLGDVPELAADSNFFLCGGDSLDLARVLVRVREAFGVELDMREVVSFSTPRRMAQCCAKSSTASRSMNAPCRHSATSVDAALRSYPCSAGQRALWLAELLGGGKGIYNTAVVVHLDGPLQVPALARALTNLLQQHEVLRSSLQPDLATGQLTGRIAPACDVVLETLDATEAEAVQVILEAAAQPFVLERGPLWRFRLLRTGPVQWRLLVCLHHAVTDGWSGAVLLCNLATAYNAAVRGSLREPQPEREFQRWCIQPPEIAEADLRWCCEQLTGADRLPGWRPAAAQRWPYAMARSECRFAAEFVTQIVATSRSLALRPATLCLTALRHALAEQGGADELCIGVPVNLRATTAQEDAVGYFVNLVVTRATLRPGDDPVAAAYAIQHGLDEVLGRRHVPFAELARRLQPALLPSGNAWCDVLFAFQNLPLPRCEFTGLQTRIEAPLLPHGQHALKLEILPMGTAWLCRIDYAQDCLTALEAEALLAAMQRQLARLLASAARSN